MLIIGIAGGTGCGKTTIVDQILSQLPEGEIGVISQDAYYNDTSNLTFEERAAINFDHPRSIDFKLLVEHLKILKSGNVIEQPIYSFVHHNRTGDTILTKPRKVMIERVGDNERRSDLYKNMGESDVDSFNRAWQERALEGMDRRAFPGHSGLTYGDQVTKNYRDDGRRGEFVPDYWKGDNQPVRRNERGNDIQPAVPQIRGPANRPQRAVPRYQPRGSPAYGA